MTLGLPLHGTRLHDQIHEGLPFEFLDHYSEPSTGVAGAISKAICMSPRMLPRRAKVGALNTLDSGRQITSIAIFEEAFYLFNIWSAKPKNHGADEQMLLSERLIIRDQ